MINETQRQIAVSQPVFGGNEERYLLDCLRSGRITQGAWVDRFEREFAAYIGTSYAVAVSSGTAALHLALVALGIGPGDEVIVPALTFIATANAVAYTGAKAIVVDVNPDTWTIDVGEVFKAITPRTKAVIPVHLYGIPADMNGLRQRIPSNIAIVEDAAESLGASLSGRKVGSIGDMGCFSLYGSKTITTGEGGMITTNDPTLYKQLRHLRGQGMTDRRYWHDAIGYNYRMTDLQAAIGVAQLEKIQSFLNARSSVFDSYAGRLRYDDRFIFQKRHDRRDSVSNWAVAINLCYDAHKTHVFEHLAERGIETRPVFYPLNQMPMYDGGKPLEIANRIARRGLVLPTHAALTDDDVAYVCQKLIEVVNG